MSAEFAPLQGLPSLNAAHTWSATQRYQVPGSSNYAVINPSGNTFIGVFSGSNYYGITPSVPGPANTAAVGGYYAGMGIGGVVSDTSSQPVFGVLASNQSGNGIGNTAFTVYANGVIQSFWVQLGAQPVASTPTIASGTVYQNTSNGYQTFDIPVYASTSGTAGTVAVAYGTSSTPATNYTQEVPGSTSSTSVGVVHLRVPPQWYYSLTTTGATMGTPTQIQE